MKPVLVVGGTSFGRLVRLLVEESGRTFAGFVDDFNTGDGIIGTRSDFGVRITCSDFDLALGVGYKDLAARWRVYEEAVAQGFRFPALVHPRAVVSAHARVADGCLVMAGSAVDAFASLAPACVLWPGAVVSHDSTIGANTFISPNATICGFVNIGQSSFLGAGCVVTDHTALPAGAFVKAAERIGKRTGQ